MAIPTDLFITEELGLRVRRAPDYLQENRALLDLARRMVDRPEEVLPGLVDLAMNVTGASAAGISLFEDHPAPGVFRWRYLRGSLERFEGATTPRNFSPCGVTLDRNSPVLSKHPERFYDWIADANIVVPEVLLVPLYLGGTEPLGTLWVVANEAGHFDSEDARAVSELAGFAGIALKMLKTEKTLHSALEEQETLTKEMAHRVNNVFAIAQAIVRMSAASATSVSDMAQTLAGRLGALASAHGLVRKSFGPGGTVPEVTDLRMLLQTILQPHEHARGGKSSRFSFDGPPIAFGERSLNGIALIFHELATNAVKYGALATPEGGIDIRWGLDKDHLTFRWIERGGPQVHEEPELKGFGSKLLRDTVARQFGGQINKQWARDGLDATITLPASGLAN